jgi:hypothetical protein
MMLLDQHRQFKFMIEKMQVRRVLCFVFVFCNRRFERAWVLSDGMLFNDFFSSIHSHTSRSHGGIDPRAVQQGKNQVSSSLVKSFIEKYASAFRSLSPCVIVVVSIRFGGAVGADDGSATRRTARRCVWLFYNSSICV